MFAVLFEVRPRPERWNDYLELARQLKPKLEAIDGFIDNERFASKSNAGWVLSLSTWRDEKSVVRWRTHGEHHGVQAQGRSAIFEDYHLRVGEITADTAPPRPVQESRFDETAVGDAKLCTITEISPGPSGSASDHDLVVTRLHLDANPGGLVSVSTFESITNQGKLLILASWRDATAGWKPMPFEGAGPIRHRRVRVIRDYGMFDRREAPQFYPDAIGKQPPG
jgi:heme-degrading monooxygenase HmoA